MRLILCSASISKTIFKPNQIQKGHKMIIKKAGFYACAFYFTRFTFKNAIKLFGIKTLPLQMVINPSDIRPEPLGKTVLLITEAADCPAYDRGRRSIIT